jgi:hypothetical protein
MNEDLRIFLATIWGEAAGSSSGAHRAIASVIMNRIGVLEWHRLGSALDVIRESGFDAFKQKNHPYREAYSAFAPAARPPMPARLRALVGAVRGIYERREPPTTPAVLYFSPKAQAALHAQDPKHYRSAPPWDFGLLEEVQPPGVLPTDDFRFFKYLTPGRKPIT